MTQKEWFSLATRIRMYDCAFGDCFRITHRNETPNSGAAVSAHLYVDFGIHGRCANENGWKENRYDDIIRDMPPDADFLLSHYHYDHYSGLLHMIHHSHYRFRNVYIPDVWNIHGSVQVVYLLLLRDLFTKTILAEGKSLLRFLISICHSAGRVYFVKRGDEIQERYVALWPTEQTVQRAAQKLRTFIRERHNIPEALEEIAIELCNLMREIGQTENQLARESLIGQLAALEQQFVDLAQQIPTDNACQKKLADFEHSINIIFQNRPDEDRNILFTGDAEKNPGLWRYIQQNTDGLVPFYARYDVIKIPHHGTAHHYHSFRNLSDRGTKYLITNGLIPRWPVTQQYAEDANHCRSAVYCSRQTCAAPCRCHNHSMICPGIFTDL